MFEEITGGMDWVQLGTTEMASRAYVAAFGFKSGEQQKKVGSCSGGERNRIHLAKLLQNEANLLLLDEPTNDLDVDTLRGLEEALLEFAGCAVITSHDRWFLDRVATHILAFEGDSEAVWFEGSIPSTSRTSSRRKGEDALSRTRPGSSTSRSNGEWGSRWPPILTCPPLASTPCSPAADCSPTTTPRWGWPPTTPTTRGASSATVVC